MAIALHGVDSAFYQRISDNVSERVRVILKEESLRVSASISEKAVQSSRQMIVRLVRDLERRGLIQPVSERFSNLTFKPFFRQGDGLGGLQ